MMPLMMTEADLDQIEVPEDYKILDATALGKRLGFKRDTVLAYLSRRNFRRIPRPEMMLIAESRRCATPISSPLRFREAVGVPQTNMNQMLCSN